MADEGKKGPTKKRCPTALKRVKQSEKSNERNSSFKSRVRTAIRSFEKALSAKNKDQMRSALKNVYSLMDKGVKHGIYKENKAARTKSRMAMLEKTA